MTNSTLYLFLLTFFLTSCFQSEETKINDKELTKIKTDIKKSILDSIAKADSAKIVVGIAKLGKKTKVVLYDNKKWDYQNLSEDKVVAKQKTTKKQVQTLMQTYEKPQGTSYASSGVCGALTKKGGRCQRKVKGGGTCYQH